MPIDTHTIEELINASTEALQLVTSNGQLLTNEPLTDQLYSENLY